MLPHLSAAVIQAESDSGVDIQIGAPASYAPWPTSRYVANMFEFMSIINGYDDEAAELFASLTDVSFPEPHTPPASERIIHYGGIEWPRRIIDEAANFGLDVEFVFRSSLSKFAIARRSSARRPGTSINNGS